MYKLSKLLGNCLLIVALYTLSIGIHPCEAAPKPKEAHSFYDLKETAKVLGMKLKWTQPAEKAVLSDSSTQIVIEKDKRFVYINDTQVWLTESTRQRGSKLYICKDDVNTILRPIMRPQHFANKCPKLYRIVIDAGHGNKDHGTINKQLNIEEKSMTLDVSLRLEKILKNSGYNVVMTRSNDTFIDLDERPRIANRKKADLFLSIHFNGAVKPEASGVETYAMTLKNHQSTGGQPSDDLQTQTFSGNINDNWNSLVGYYVQKHLHKELKSDDRGLKRARFRVLRYLECPGLLIEAGFITNNEEARHIQDPAYREHMAQAIARGVFEYQKALNKARKKQAA